MNDLERKGDFISTRMSAKELTVFKLERSTRKDKYTSKDKHKEQTNNNFYEIKCIKYELYLLDQERAFHKKVFIVSLLCGALLLILYIAFVLFMNRHQIFT